MFQHDKNVLRDDIYECCNTRDSCKGCKYDSKVGNDVLCYLILSAIGTFLPYNVEDK